MQNRDQHDARSTIDFAEIDALLRQAATEEPFMSPDERREVLARHLERHLAVVR